MNSIHAPLRMVADGPRPEESCKIIFVAERLAVVMLRKGVAGTWVTSYVPTNVTLWSVKYFRIVGVALFSNLAIAIKEK